MKLEPPPQLEWLEPWQQLEGAAEGFARELQKELTPRHVLHGLSITAVARRRDCDEVLFATSDPAMPLAVVHLTRTGCTESFPQWPQAVGYKSWDDWVTTCLLPDHRQYRDEEFRSSRLGQLLRPILADTGIGERIAELEGFRDLLVGLESFVPQLLRELYPEWKRESLDGIYPWVARKTGEGTAEIFGLCIMITDQTLAPLHIRFQVGRSGDEISWAELRLGERGQNGMVRMPYLSPSNVDQLLHRLEGRANLIDWHYQVTIGTED